MTTSEPPTETGQSRQTLVICAVHQHLACPAGCAPNTAPLSPTSTEFQVVRAFNHNQNRGLGPPPPIPPRSTRPDFKRPTVVEVSDSDTDDSAELDLEKLRVSNESSRVVNFKAPSRRLTVVEVSDCDFDSDDSNDLAKLELGKLTLSGSNFCVKDGNSVPDALEGLHRIHRNPLLPTSDLRLQSTSVTNTAKKSDALPPVPRGTTESRPMAKKSSTQISTKPSVARLPIPTSSTSSSAQTPRRRKQVFYVVTKGRRTGVFDSWLYVDWLVKGFDSTYKSYKDKDEAIEAFLGMKRLGLVKQSGIYQPDLFPNAPEDLSAE